MNASPSTGLTLSVTISFATRVSLRKLIYCTTDVYTCGGQRLLVASTGVTGQQSHGQESSPDRATTIYIYLHLPVLRQPLAVGVDQLVTESYDIVQGELR